MCRAAPAAAGRLAFSSNTPFAWLSAAPHVGGGWGSAGGDAYAVELYGPVVDQVAGEGAADQPSRLEVGRTIGFQVAVWDVDRQPSPRSYTVTYLGGRNVVVSRHAGYFVDGLLVDPARPTSVTPASWGRIKAALR